MASVGYETRIRIGEQFYNRITADNVKRFIKYKNEKSLKNILSILFLITKNIYQWLIH